MNSGDLNSVVSELRAAGGDTAGIEVKSAAGGLPASLTSTLSALANLPGGGLIILGLDERRGFQPVPLANPQALKQGLAAKARSFKPPVQLSIEDGTVDGALVITAILASRIVFKEQVTKQHLQAIAVGLLAIVMLSV